MYLILVKMSPGNLLEIMLADLLDTLKKLPGKCELHKNTGNDDHNG